MKDYRSIALAALFAIATGCNSNDTDADAGATNFRFCEITGPLEFSTIYQTPALLVCSEPDEGSCTAVAAGRTCPDGIGPAFTLLYQINGTYSLVPVEENGWDVVSTVNGTIFNPDADSTELRGQPINFRAIYVLRHELTEVEVTSTVTVSEFDRPLLSKLRLTKL